LKKILAYFLREMLQFLLKKMSINNRQKPTNKAVWHATVQQFSAQEIFISTMYKHDTNFKNKFIDYITIHSRNNDRRSTFFIRRKQIVVL